MSEIYLTTEYLVPLFIPSKDRGCQLHLLFRSIKENCNIFYPSVLAKISNEEFQAGYDKAIQVISNRLIQEEDIRKDFLHFLEHNKYICMSTDDTVVYRKLDTSYDEIDQLMQDEDIWCLSFRLGLNTIVQDYSTGRLQPKLEYYEEVGNWIKWPWRSYDENDNYGYVGGQDFVLYRCSDLLSYLKDYEFTTLRSVEAYISNKCRPRIKREYMASPKQSIAVNIPLNNMQVPYIDNPSQHQISPEQLNQKFLEGFEIDLEKIMQEEVKGCHQNILIQWKSH